MTLQDWIPVLTTTGLLSGAAWIGRNWIAQRLQASMQHKFDGKIEHLRAEFRKSEAEIHALQSGALSRRSIRQSIVEEKRIEAVEAVWADVIKLAVLKANAQSLSILNLETIRESQDTQQIQNVFSVIARNLPAKEELKTSARNHRPFIDDVIWSYYELYTQILLYYYAYTEVGKLGELKFIKETPPVKELLQKTMPHYSEYVEKHGVTSYYYLLEDIQDKLLRAIQKSLDGTDFDKEEVTRAGGIISAVEEFRMESQKKPTLS